MKLVLYSGGQTRENHEIHRRLVELSGRVARKRMTYVPFCAEGAEVFFHRMQRRYGAYGVTDFLCLPVDRDISSRALRSALAGDIIYLAGGNTYYFLHHLRKQGLLPRLRAFAREGGVLAGLSAGALILTPNIQLAGIPKFDADENEIGLRDLRALGLTRFEFSPHYSASKRRDDSLIRYSRRSELPILACADGGGVIIDGNRFTAIGNLRLFYRGHKTPLT